MKRYMDAMIDDICRLVEIPSVYEQSDNYPFGAAIDRCLDTALEMMARLGFRTHKDPEGMYAYAEIGEGPLFGVLGHLDVVNARQEDGWEHEPFQPVILKDFLCGRGTQDDKGPMVAAIYALKSLLDDGYHLNHRVRFVFGADEEMLWRCMAAYGRKEETPVCGFTPDSAFPLTYAEKGLLQVRILDAAPSPIAFSGGDSFNAVSSHAACPWESAMEEAMSALHHSYQVTDGQLVAKGITAHAKNPWKGVNANLNLVQALRLAGYHSGAIDFICDTLVDRFRFEGFTDRDLSDFSGPVTINLGKVEASAAGTVLSVDLRLPVSQSKEAILELLWTKAAAYGLTVEEYDWLRPIHVPLDQPLVQNLLSAYREVTGDTVTEPYISAGATYARAFDNCVAFGANLPSSPTSEHQPNERIPLAGLLQAAEIYRCAFIRTVTTQAQATGPNL